MIGKAQHMAEFVTERTDARRFHTRVTIDFAGTGIGVDGFAVKREVDTRFREFVLVWPDAVFRSTVVLAIACIEHKDHIHFAVFIIVVLRKVDVEVGVGFLAGIAYHQLGMLVAAHVAVAAIVAHDMVERHGAYYVECGAELSHRLVSEVVACRAERSGEGATLFVHDTLEILGIGRELYVAELREDDKTTHLALGREGAYLHVAGLGSTLWSPNFRCKVIQSEGDECLEEGFFFDRTHFHIVGCRRGCYAIDTTMGELCITQPSVLVLLERMSVGCGDEMTMFIALYPDMEGCAIGLCALHGASVGGDGIERE